MAFLEELREMGVVKRFYVVRCPVCGFLMQDKYKNEKEIPEEVECLSCGNDIGSPERYKEIIYQII